jgi:hypothetical protein
MSIQVNAAKDSEEFKKFYIGNLKEGKETGPKTLNSATIATLPNVDDLPF